MRTAIKSTSATYRHCTNCGNWVYTDRPEDSVICGDCRCDQGELVDVNVGEGSPAHCNTSYYTGVLMKPYEPGDDVLIEIDGRRVYYEAKRVFDVRRAAPRTGGF